MDINHDKENMELVQKEDPRGDYLPVNYALAADSPFHMGRGCVPAKWNYIIYTSGNGFHTLWNRLGRNPFNNKRNTFIYSKRKEW